MDKICEKCGKKMVETQFYQKKDKTYFTLCKKCLTMHIDNFKPETFIWIIKEANFPYIEQEWNTLRDKAFAKDPIKMNGMSVIGKYFSKMRLGQWKEYNWDDTERLQKEYLDNKLKVQAEREQYEAQIKADYEAGKISEAEYKTWVSAESQNNAYKYGASADAVGSSNMYNEGNFISEEEVNPAADLTEDDKKALALKWGRLYTPNEWLLLEKDYQEMMHSFDIQDADTMNTLIFLCKTNLKANQAIDNGDIEGFQKLVKVAETLRKTAKFTAAQNKEDKNNFVDSVGELVAICERDGGFIPPTLVDIPQDIVDLTLKDMENYLYKLVTQDLGFGQQIEDSIKKIQIQKEMNEQEDNELDDDEELILENEDHAEFYNEIESQKEKDNKIMKGEE